jgi:hypothetical protein
MDPNMILGYAATSASVIAYGSQFVHTIKTKSISGLSLNRTVLDTMSLVLWVGYAARLEDIPLLTATSCELFMSLCLCILILKTNRNKLVTVGVKYNQGSSRTSSSDDSVTISVRSDRRNSV